MMWTTIPASDSRPELPQTFKSTALVATVARRERASDAAVAASANAASPAAAPAAAVDTADRSSSKIPPPAPRSAGPQQGKKRPSWQPQPLPKPKATDFVVVIKPRTQLSLTAVFPENGAGSALIAHLGANANQMVTVVMVREQNLILAYTPHPLIADKLIGELTVPSSVGPVPLFGYLRADTEDSCYGVVTVRSSDSEAELRQRFYWPEGEILHIRRLGTSNKVRLTFAGKVKPRYVTYDALLIPVQPYRKTVPACNQCGSVGHRPDACPGPKPDLCDTCGNTVPLMDGARAPHECTPKCALCAGLHVTGDRCCRERYRAPPPKPSTLPPENQTGSKKRKKRWRTRKPRKPTTGTSPQGAQAPATKPTPPPQPGAGAPGPSKRGPTPAGPPAARSTSSQGSPASPTPHPLPPLPAAQGDATWAAHVRQGPQVSGSGGAASQTVPPQNPPKPPTSSAPTREQFEIKQLRAQVASLTRAMEALANRPPPPNPTPSGQAPEAMDSASSEQRDTTAILAPIEARLNSLEGQVASIVTTIEDRLAAALQTVFASILGMIVAQLPQLASSTRRPTPKLKRVNKPQTPRPLPQMAEANRQPTILTATPAASPGSSGGAPLDLSALLEATQNSNTHDGGQRL
ncbi:uncharacterized protein LOC119382246 [Rhipicephalus sanguineus]|uniref:uncharacterized protein LOC119382246 n=1 Tax=Rhipicephalus sanguineus TaxID=34632 RepID=UPI00189331ED|nr:uncharacterized protein LOC119382246 [Rhipicephalus sanguineus]